MQAQLKSKVKSKSKSQQRASAPADPAPVPDLSHTDVAAQEADTDADAGNLRSELFALREQSMDAFQALVCSIVRHEKENKATTSPSTTMTTATAALVQSPAQSPPTSHAQSPSGVTSASVLRASASSAPLKDGPRALSLADALLLEAPLPPTHDPSTSGTPFSTRRTNKSHNQPSSSSSIPSPHSAATSLLQVLSQRASPSARRRHSFASLSSMSSPSQISSSVPPTSANTPEAPTSPRTSSGMMKSLRSRFRSNSISSPPPDSVDAPTRETAPPTNDTALESPVHNATVNPSHTIALNASTTSMDLAFALASLLEDVTVLLVSDSKPSSNDLARVQAAMDDLVELVDRKKAAPASITSATETMCESTSAFTHPDGMLESATGETASVHTIGPDVDPRHVSDTERAKENTKEKRYSADPPPYEAHDFNKSKHSLHPLNKKASDKQLKSAPQLPSELELEKLVVTIERLNRRGRLDDQAVHLTTKQRDQLEDAAITARIDRLARGRLEDQRAVSSANEQTQLMAAITDSNKSRSLVNQRVEVSFQTQRRIELARLGHLADRLANSGRMEDQDAVPKRVRELDRLARELERLSRPSGMDSQRYTMNDVKEKDMFLSQMAHRVSRLTDCRMEDQAADGPGVRKAAAFNEVDQALDRMAALSSSHMMDGQRYHV